MLKFQKSLNDYNYCLSFDLAKHLTGWSLIDFRNMRVLLSGEIDTANCDQYIWKYYYDAIYDALRKSLDYVGMENHDQLFITKEKLPNQAGKFTTIDALQALAQAHAICNLAMVEFGENNGVDVYDYNGVHAASVKAYFRAITEIAKPTKDDIANKIKELFPGDQEKLFTLDITDSIAVALTLINSKWNKDIDEEMREVRRQIKQFKTDKKVDELNSYIEKLQSLKIDN